MQLTVQTKNIIFNSWKLGGKKKKREGTKVKCYQLKEEKFMLKKIVENTFACT